MQTDHIIQRTGLPPIKFIGEELASASSQGLNSTRWTVINIYKSKGGRYLAELKHKTIWSGERDTYYGGSFATPAELIEFLKEGDTTLGRVSQEAVEEAAKTDPAFAAAWVENVD